MEEALRIYRATHGPDNQDVATSLKNLASILTSSTNDPTTLATAKEQFTQAI